MCVQCQEWASQANLLWNELYREVDELRSLVPRFPPPIAFTANQMLGGITWTQQGINSCIQYLGTECPQMLQPGDASALVLARATLISEGWKWMGCFRPVLQYAKASLPIWGGIAAAAAAPGPSHDISHQMFSTWLNSLNRMKDDTNRTLDEIEASNRAINQSWLNALRGS